MQQGADAGERTDEAASVSQHDVDFLADLDFLKGWSKQCLENHDGKIQRRHYKRTAVIVRNSGYSKWICVIRSGSAQVMMVLDRVSPSLQLEPHQRRQRQRQQQQQQQPTLEAFYDSSGLLATWSITGSELPYPRTPRGGGGADSGTAGPLVTQMVQLRRPQTGSRWRPRQTSDRRRPGSPASASAVAKGDRPVTCRTASGRADGGFSSQAAAGDDPATNLVAPNQLDRRFHQFDDDTELQMVIGSHCSWEKKRLACTSIHGYCYGNRLFTRYSEEIKGIANALKKGMKHQNARWRPSS